MSLTMAPAPSNVRRGEYPFEFTEPDPDSSPLNLGRVSVRFSDSLSEALKTLRTTRNKSAEILLDDPQIPDNGRTTN